MQETERFNEYINPTEAARTIKSSLLHDRNKWEEIMGDDITEAVESLMMNAFKSSASMWG